MDIPVQIIHISTVNFGSFSDPEQWKNMPSLLCSSHPNGMSFGATLVPVFTNCTCVSAIRYTYMSPQPDTVLARSQALVATCQTGRRLFSFRRATFNKNKAVKEPKIGSFGAHCFKTTKKMSHFRERSEPRLSLHFGPFCNDARSKNRAIIFITFSAHAFMRARNKQTGFVRI